MSASPASAYTKEIVYDRESRDYAMYLDAELVGFARTYHEAEITLDRLVYELLSGGADEEPEPVNWSDRDPEASSWSTEETPPSDPLPTDGPGAPIPGDEDYEEHCRNCTGPHHTWQCPEIHARLSAPETPPWKDVALGRELCRMRWHNFKAFVALLLSVPAAHLGIYAESYVAFIRDHDQDTTLTTMDVLKVWTRIMTTAPSMQAA